MICVFCRAPFEELEAGVDGSNFGVCKDCERTELSETTIDDGEDEPNAAKLVEELSKTIFRDPRE